MAKVDCSSKILNHLQLVGLIPVLRAGGKRIVATSGVFDLWHDGHAHYLEDAGRLGDILVVGVDSDAMVTGRKGPNRPIHGQAMRLQLVVACGAVDFALIMDDWHAFMRIASPHVIVISPTTEGADNFDQKRLALQVGADLVSVPSRSPTHTTDIVKRILKLGA